MDLPDMCSVDELTERYSFLSKLQTPDSQLNKCMQYVERCAELEMLLELYRSFICSHFKSLLQILLERPNVVQFETFLLDHMRRLDAILNYNRLGHSMFYP
jgi:hypothetical protein